jgi:hypothetical protein
MKDYEFIAVTICGLAYAMVYSELYFEKPKDKND